jgi:hypothetical protein
MFCPNCGSNNSTEQKFCRSCGINLQQTALSLLEQIPSAKSAELIRKRRTLEKLGGIAFTGLGIVIGLGILGLLYSIFVKMVLSGTEVYEGIAMMLFIVFASLSLAYVILNETLKDKESKIGPDLAKEIDKARKTGKLLEEGNFEPVMSVTERTTNLLHVENKPRDRE